MSNNTISEKPAVHFLDINASVVENYPSALQDIVLNRRFDGMIIRDVLPQDTVERIVRQLGSDDNCMKPIHFKPNYHIKILETYGQSITGKPSDLKDYFAVAAVFRQACRTLFQEDFDFEERVESIFRSLCGGLPVQVPTGPEGQTYTPATIRLLPEGYQIPIHVGNDFRDMPSSTHLKTLIDISDQLSYFIVLSVPEAGGELEVYNIEWTPKNDTAIKPETDYAVTQDKPETRPLQKVDISLSDTRLPTSFSEMSTDYSVAQDNYMFEVQSWFPSQPPESVAFVPRPGDMLLFNGGSYYHRVTPIVGHRPRITIGGFLSFSKEHDGVYYWS